MAKSKKVLKGKDLAKSASIKRQDAAMARRAKEKADSVGWKRTFKKIKTKAV